MAANYDASITQSTEPQDKSSCQQWLCNVGIGKRMCNVTGKLHVEHLQFTPGGSPSLCN